MVTEGWSGPFRYKVNYLDDDKHAIIVDVEGTPARLSQEIVAAKTMLERQVAGYSPKTIAADKSYGTGRFLSWFLEHKITPYSPVLDRKAQTLGKFTRDAFDYDAANDLYVCPHGHQLPLKSIDENTRVKRYKATPSQCHDCPLKSRCTDAPSRAVMGLMDEEARQTVRDLASIEAFQVARTQRKKMKCCLPTSNDNRNKPAFGFEGYQEPKKNSSSLPPPRTSNTS